MMSDDWVTSSETVKLKLELQKQEADCVKRLLSAAGVSPDPKCTELARELRKIQEFLKMLSGDKNAQRSD